MNYFKLGDIIWQRVFGYPMGPEAKRFWQNVSFVSVGTLGASVLGFFVMIVAGRILGPFEYGKANLVFSIGSVLLLVMTLGFPYALVKNIVQEREVKRIVPSLFVITIAWAFAMTLVLLLVSHPLSRLLRVDLLVFLFAIAFALTHVFVVVSKSLFQGLQQFGRFAAFHVLSALFFVLFFFGFANLGEDKSFTSLIFAEILRWLFPVLIGFFLLRSLIFPMRIHWKNTKTLLSFSIWVFLGLTPGYLFGYIDRLMIHYFLGSTAVGFYSAYVLSSTVMLERGLGVFLAVFFPYSSAAPHKKILFRKINRFMAFLAVPATGLLYGIIAFALLLFGPEYEFNVVLILLFSVNGFLFFVSSIYSWLLFSMEIKTVRFGAFIPWAGLVINVFCNTLLIPVIGLYGAVVATIAAFLFVIVSTNIYFATMKKEVPEQKHVETSR
ncbi:MAG TPA: oligosaccharide flippase family protein [Candidatus Paceibacterota bacterium]|nr:oligosaccharide flippase family protein [Candidatus Paceibacterota bacterium]